MQEDWLTAGQCDGQYIIRHFRQMDCVVDRCCWQYFRLSIDWQLANISVDISSGTTNIAPVCFEFYQIFWR